MAERIPAGADCLLATTLCGAVVGALVRIQSKSKFRVTLHLVLKIHNEELLQQACEYVGRGLDSSRSGAARTFPTAHATIGLAYGCRKIVRSLRGVDPTLFQSTMTHLRLNLAASKMAPEVRFVLAIPILQPQSSFFPPSPVAAIVYIDSRSSDFWLSNTEISDLCILIGTLWMILRSGRIGHLTGCATPLTDIDTNPNPPADLPVKVADALELLTSVRPPCQSAL